ncbi:Translocase of chloroplast [Serendipita sp. 396]|nr:Translocase of chloroplast [Serendipita sp. 396]KAG8784655.1 Translocase of chloroplast [Serendipita sp. 397]KAG8800333.1 Translocase of chloroplast [Serendipita sp. 398]KAG8816633.1 Translocase of chloroplast [Serendipita sp. 401]KAG8832680.1 Translocase of chloroplast [Serendipita sp. 400]KAG8852774.1 Translocase of chloroplast [Serendipita sp. 411]KAG8868127.1 Translocase of chloroplast [Serendipita sp. 405]KAG9054136.1 Translocase of chloroplast [Serendipita sp. 407]
MRRSSLIHPATRPELLSKGGTLASCPYNAPSPPQASTVSPTVSFVMSNPSSTSKTPEEKVVVVLGTSASGKTTFINLATQRGDQGVGGGINSCTTKVDWVKSSDIIEGRKVSFIDTPGLDDATKPDTEIIVMVKDFLNQKKIRPDTILYLYPISNNRVPGSELERFKLVMRYWDSSKVPNIVIVTTKWDLAPEEGDAREENLRKVLETELMATSYQVKRFLRTTQSALDVLRSLPLPEKVVVALGPTGAGKTTFINLAAQRGDHGVGHEIDSCTTVVDWVRPSNLIEGHKVTFIDTPGFNGTEGQDVDIVNMIKDSLDKAQIRLDTVLYFHPISENRMSGSSLRCLKLFASSWQNDKVPNLVIVTTMWGDVTPKVGEERENELKSKFWAELITNGCEVKRLHLNADSVLDILRTSLSKGSSPSSSDHRRGAARTAIENKMPGRRQFLERLLRDLFRRMLASRLGT